MRKMHKAVIVIFAMAISFSSFAEPKKTCGKRSVDAVKGAFPEYFEKDEESGTQRKIEHVLCYLSSKKTAIECDINAGNGDGAGDVSFLVTFKSDCSKVLSVELTGEE